MRVFISCDMEGVGGVTKWSETFIGGDADGFARARKRMTDEVNAAVEGAVSAGASEVVVRDAHGASTSILVEDLHPAARLITGTPAPMSMGDGLDDTFSAAFLVGYHARAGQPGVLNHTYTGSITAFTINGRVYGEAGMTAGLAGSMGVPVALVVGDDITAREVAEYLGPVRTVVTKEARGRYAALSHVPARVLDDIRREAGAALDPDYLSSLTPLSFESPVTFEIGFATTHLADQAARIQGAILTSPLSVSVTEPTYPEALEKALAMIYMGFG